MTPSNLINTILRHFNVSLTHQVVVGGRLFEQHLGDVTQRERDDGGRQHHGRQVVAHLTDGVAEQLTAHFIEVERHL